MLFPLPHYIPFLYCLPAPTLNYYLEGKDLFGKLHLLKTRGASRPKSSLAGQAGKGEEIQSAAGFLGLPKLCQIATYSAKLFPSQT